MSALPAKVPAVPPSGPFLRHILGDELDGAVAAALDGYNPRAKEVNLPVFLLEGGRPWDIANEWMRDKFGGSTTNTRVDYAGDVLGFVSWCTAEGIDPEIADSRDLKDYREVRLNEDGVSGGTWNRNLAGIANFMEWMEKRDGLKRLPDKMTQLRIEEGTQPVLAVDLDTYRVFRDVGLRGMTLDGHPAPNFPGRTGERDHLYADLLISTGLRRSEGGLLLLLDLPLAARGTQKIHNLNMPGVICKRGKARQVLLLDVFLQRHWSFIETEWYSIVALAQGAYRRAPLIMVDSFHEGRVRIKGKSKRVDMLPPSDRRRLVTTSDVARELGLPVEDDWLVPLGLFPGHRVPIPRPASWTKTFERAEERTQAHLASRGIPKVPSVRPHILRHTYGVEYLRSAMEMLGEQDREKLMTSDERRIRQYFENPLTELRRLMGHERMDTTLGYLHTLRRTDPLATMPWSSWADELLAE